MLTMKTIILGFVDLSFIIYQYTVIFLIVLAIFQQKMTLGFLTLFSILVYRVYHNLKEIIGEYKIIEDVSNYIESMNNLFFRPLISKETYNPNHLPLKPKNFNITIKNLKFKNE
jgi:ABC-type bacteriocin/lantibiotic exporter with double-glycine peptidase domain